eukprot:127917_1
MATEPETHHVEHSVSLDDRQSPPPSKKAEEVTQDNESISQRRTRKLTNLLFDEIAGNKLKCYQKWKLWAGLCAIATVIAIAATIVATALAVEHSASYKTKSEAIIAQNTIITELFKSNISNETDHSNEVRRIFNTFDEDQDGLWDIDEFADHLNRATEREATFNKIDLDKDDILSFDEVTLAKSQEPPYLASVFSHELIQNYYNYTGPKNHSLYWQYQANVFFNMYGAAGKGYITRDMYYRHHAKQKFDSADLDSSGSIDFDEFSTHTIDVSIIDWFKSPTITSWIDRMLFKPFKQRRANSSNYTASFINIDGDKMCPAQMSASQNRRRMGVMSADEYYDYYYDYWWYYDDYLVGKDSLWKWEESSGDIRYVIECALKDGCRGIGPFATDCIDYKMRRIQKDEVFECLVSLYECMGPEYFHYCFGDEEQAKTNCDCYCIDYRDSRRRSLKNQECVAASCDDNECFAGDNLITIRREDEVQDIRIKEVQVGDYVRSRYGGWTKVWWVKKMKREGIPHLKLYFGEEEPLTLTPNHLLYVNVLEDRYTKAAREVGIGDVLFVYDVDHGAFVEKKVIDIGYATEGVTYGPSTMDGTIVVSNVVASAYEGSYEIAKEIHRMTAMVRFISEYISQDLAVIVTDLNFYYVFDPLQRYNLGYIIFNSYSTPFITIATIGAPIMISMKIIRHLS